MNQYALGLIETIGLVSAIEAADAATKAANIKLIAYELTNGGGMVTVKITGDVAAVQAAVNAAKVAADQVGTVVAAHVIPRPHNEIKTLIYSEDNVERKKQEKNTGKLLQKKSVTEKTGSSSKKAGDPKGKKRSSPKSGKADSKTSEQTKIEVQEKPEITDTNEQKNIDAVVSPQKKDEQT